MNVRLLAVLALLLTPIFSYSETIWSTLDKETKIHTSTFFNSDQYFRLGNGLSGTFQDASLWGRSNNSSGKTTINFICYENSIYTQYCGEMGAVSSATSITTAAPGVEQFFSTSTNFTFHPEKFYALTWARGNALTLQAFGTSSPDICRDDAASGACNGTPYLVINAETAPPPCTVDCFSNVLFLPGIEASRLYRPSVIIGTDEKELWLPGDNADAMQLVMNPDGTSFNNDVYTRDIVDNAYVPIKGDIYKTFIEDMDALVSAGTVSAWEPAPYDWRLTLNEILSKGAETSTGISYLTATNTPFIEQTLRELAATSKSGKVTIVAHSNGGLVAKALMQRLGDAETAALIDKVILVAVPQVGTPHALAALLHGHEQGLPIGWFPSALSPSTARAVGDTMPGLYNLLPSEAYFSSVNDPVATFSPSIMPDWAAQYGATVNTVESQNNFLTDAITRAQPSAGDLISPTILNSSHVSAAQNVHATLDAWVPPPGVKVIQIAGWGIPTTVSGIAYGRKQTEDGEILTAEPKFVVDGDGTVVTPSALWVGEGDGVENYWADLKKYSDDHRLITVFGVAPFNHGSVFEVDPVRNFVSDLITSSTKSLADYGYLSTEVPVSSEPRLRYSLHSPLTLSLYDSLGRHTGVSTTTGEVEELIPSTYYTEFGDVKYIFSDATAPALVIMDGYADGTFTLNVDQLTGNNVTASTTFKDIPTTPDTVATISVVSGVDTITPLAVDSNGDGTADFTLAPVPNGVATLDTTPPSTIASTTGTPALNGWYKSAVTVSLSATDVGSGVEATYASLDGMATTSTTSVAIIADGTHTVRFFSEDNAGNTEEIQTLVVKIDTLPPEATILADTATRDLLVIGKDTNATTVTKSGNTAMVTDEAGHTTKLTFQKTYSGKILTYAKLVSVSYNGAVPVALPSSFLYAWNTKVTPPALLSQTVVADKTFGIQATYDKAKNKTTIIILKKGLKIQTQTVPGLAIVKLITNRGNITYEW